MGMTIDEAKTIIYEIRTAISDSRQNILDLVEQEMYGSQKWDFVRSRLLRYLGESGLERRIAEIISKEIGFQLDEGNK